MWIDVLYGLGEISQPDHIARIPKDLPLYVFSGARDPVGDDTRSVKHLVDLWKAAGLRDVEHRFYEDGRHELFNDTNRDEVTADLLAWIDRVL